MMKRRVQIEMILSVSRLKEEGHTMAKIKEGEKYYIDVGFRKFFNKKVRVVKQNEKGYTVKLLEWVSEGWPKYTKITNVRADELNTTKWKVRKQEPPRETVSSLLGVKKGKKNRSKDREQRKEKGKRKGKTKKKRSRL